MTPQKVFGLMLQECIKHSMPHAFHSDMYHDATGLAKLCPANTPDTPAKCPPLLWCLYSGGTYMAVSNKGKASCKYGKEAHPEARLYYFDGYTLAEVPLADAMSVNLEVPNETL